MKKLLFIFVFYVCCNNLNIGQTVNCKVFLQGTYMSASLMDTSLVPFMPIMQPYNTLPWNYDGNESISLVPNNMVDWVLVELRDSLHPTWAIARKAGLLLANGDIADASNLAPLGFSNVSPGHYYLCIYHRNHFPVMSASPVAIPASTLYDFSDTLNFFPYGGGSNALIELEPGVFGMISGDVNKDGTLKYSGPNNDRGPVLQYIVNQTGSTSITTIVSGYAEEDINMDSIIKYSGPGNDPSQIIQNLVGLTGSSSITTIYNSVVPLAYPPIQCNDSIVDQRDGNKYPIVRIGSQCWMAKNFAYLPSVSPPDSASNILSHYYVYDYYGNDVNTAKATTNYQTYGVLYNFPAAMAGDTGSNTVPSGVQGVCPAGWHVPSDEEWKILEGEVDSQYGYPDPEWDGWSWRGTDAGGNLKETDTVHWDSPNTGATNSSGFNALPGGFRAYNSSFLSLSLLNSFWSSTWSFGDNFWFRRMDYNNADILRGAAGKNDGKSVRCLKDCLSQSTQSNAGPDSLNIEGDSIILMANIPQYGQGIWTIANGTGGSFADSTNPTTLFHGQAGNTYKLVWTISNNCGSTSDTVMISFASQGFSCGDQLVDSRDGISYNTVLIGTQCWMADNLVYLPSVSPSGTGSETTVHYYVYGYEGSDTTAAKATSNYQTYGVLYNWPAAMAGSLGSNNVPSGVQGACPAEWHLPSDEEWKILEGEVDSFYSYPDPEWDGFDYRGTDAGGNLKETGTTHWNSPNLGATNSSGFTALPGGYRDSGGSFSALGNYAYLWTSTDIYTNKAWYRYMQWFNAGVARQRINRANGYSVRCLKD